MPTAGALTPIPPLPALSAVVSATLAYSLATRPAAATPAAIETQQPSQRGACVAPDPREPCSGHGMAEDGVCRCDDCFKGARCEKAIAEDECVVAASIGTPFVFEDYWLAMAGTSAGGDGDGADSVSNRPNCSKRGYVGVQPFYHIGYGSTIRAGGCGGFGGGDCPNRLESEVRALHAAVGNFNPDGFHYVGGVGSTELIAAAMFALGGGEDGAAYSSAPYYNGHRNTAKFFGRRWADTPQEAAAAPAGAVEFVTSPSSADGALRTREVPGATAVWDSAYYWPHFTPVVEDRAQAVEPSDVALFTLSKLTGHASSRVGWAWCRNARLCNALAAYVGVNGGVSREAQLRAATVLSSERVRGYPILAWARERMAARWEALEGTLGGSCLQLQNRGDAHQDVWSGETYRPSPAYAWIECQAGAAQAGGAAGDCAAALLAAAGIKGSGGKTFGAGMEYVRVELLLSQRSYEIVMRKLQGFVQQYC